MGGRLTQYVIQPFTPEGFPVAFRNL